VEHEVFYAGVTVADFVVWKAGLMWDRISCCLESGYASIFISCMEADHGNRKETSGTAVGSGAGKPH
jgi:hypothetical protein